ncbi:Ig-like domain-containing protein [Escherichia coli]
MRPGLRSPPYGRSWDTYNLQPHADRRQLCLSGAGAGSGREHRSGGVENGGGRRTINPTATPGIVSYTDDVGQRQGTLSSSQATDDTTPLLNGVLSAPLASGEVVYLYRNGLLLGAVTMVGALNWTYSDSGLVSGAYTYSARVVDLAGNITSSSDFVLTVITSIPTMLAQIAGQTTRDHADYKQGDRRRACQWAVC